jgi:phosphatidylglycerol:prolipoprotein diacylglycerol transferase
MHPTLIDLGTYDLPLLGDVHLALPTYGFLFAMGAVAAWWWFSRRARSMDLPDEPVFNLAFYTLLAGLLGAKLFLVIVEWRYYLSDPVRILGTIRSAGVLLGGVTVAALVFIGYCRRHDLPVFRLGDAIAAPLALAQASGRLGCFTAGCCYGRGTDHPWFHTTFTSPEAHDKTGVPLDVPLVPTQLIEMSVDLALVAILTLMWRRQVRPPGTTFITYAILYGTARFVIEFWRGDTTRGVYFGGALSTSQILSAAGVLIAALFYLWYRKRYRETASP